MIENVSDTMCTGCAACVDRCPQNCISMGMDPEGFSMPIVMEELCIHCNSCQNVCPALNTYTDSLHRPTAAYAAWNKAPEIVMKSSSGGAFWSLAKYVIDQGGAVFGAAFKEGLYVRHQCADTIDKLMPLLRAKYLQSDMTSIYETIKKVLDTGQIVLFAGMPCQAAAVRSFFRDSNDNLYIVESICHGIPSQTVFQECNKNIEHKYKDLIKNYEFHSKKRSWRSNTVHIKFSNGGSIELDSFHNPFMFGFFRNIILRKSCYECHFRKEYRSSDVILGDFWEIDRINSKLNRNTGVSLILTLTQKGMNLLGHASDTLEKVEVNCEETVAIKKNLKEIKYDDLSRRRFMEHWKEHGYASAEKKYLRPPAYQTPLKMIKDYIKINIEKRWR